jgi:hypothetical protein
MIRHVTVELKGNVSDLAVSPLQLMLTLMQLTTQEEGVHLNLWSSETDT